MTTLPLAHVGHWLVNVLYLVPLLIVVAMLAISSLRDRRAAAAADGAAPAVPPDAGGDESPESPADAPAATRL